SPKDGKYQQQQDQDTQDLDLLPTVACKPEQHEKQVDEVEVKGQRAEDGRLSPLCAVGGQLLDLPGIVCGQPGEDDHSDRGYDPGNRAAAYEDVDDRGDHHADQPHEEETSPRGQVTLGHVTVHAHGSEHAGGNDKGRSDRVGRVDQGQDRKGDPVQCRIADEQERCHVRTQPVDGAGQGENKGQLSDHQSEENHPVPGDSPDHHWRGECDQRHNCSYAKSCAHPGVNLPYKGILSDDCLLCGTGVAGINFIHEKPPFN